MTAIAADHVVARESAITGSIGVIFQYGTFRGAAAEDRRRIRGDEERAAEGRAVALPRAATRRPTAMLKRVDRRHLRLVRRARRRAPQASDGDGAPLADGSIYSGRQALRLKLIDAVGGDEEARAWLADGEGHFGGSAARANGSRTSRFFADASGRTRWRASRGSSASMPTRRRFCRGDLQLTVCYLFGRLHFSGDPIARGPA